MTALFFILSLLTGVSLASLIVYFRNYTDERPDLGGFGGPDPD